MKITFISVGAVKKASVKEGVDEYLRRIGNYSRVESVEVKEESSTPKTPRERILKKEGERILGRLSRGDYVVALADSGKEFTSASLAAFVEGFMESGRKNLCFVTGGAFGLHKDVLGSADMILSLSRMTLPHDLARLVLAEQVYRAFTIIRNEPYSH